MFRYMCKSKIHMATITDANIKYKGSITIDEKLMKAADLLPYERVQVLNASTGARLETYVIKGSPGSGEICLNGPAARLGEIGDKVVVISYGLYDKKEVKKLKPKAVFVDEKNRMKKD